jgi:hypothetical protein
MSSITDSLTIDYSQRNLRGESFKDEHLVQTSFHGSDLRGADFSGADLTGADLSNAKTGIPPLQATFIFLIAFLVSLLSGYVAMLAGTTVQAMFKSEDDKIKAAGIITLVIILAFISYYYWKGGRSVIKNLLLPAFVLSIVIGVIGYTSGVGTGIGMLFLVLSLLLTVMMIAIGTIARALAGVLSSSILFILVAVGGSVFGKTVGGGMGTVILAVSCALISKRALSGTRGFESLRKLAAFITRKFGTSFENAILTRANFSESKIYNTDYTNAELSSVNWTDSKKKNCTPIGFEKDPLSRFEPQSPKSRTEDAKEHEVGSSDDFLRG